MIILLGLQIFKVANQLLNGTGVTDLGLPSLPIFDTYLPNFKTTLSPIDTREDYWNQSYLGTKFHSNNNLKDFSKRSGFIQTLTQNNQSIPTESQRRVYSNYNRDRVVPKPYPYSRDNVNTDQSVQLYPNTGPKRSDDKFSSDYIKPNWNQFEDSIDESLNEPENYLPHHYRIKTNMDQFDNPPEIKTQVQLKPEINNNRVEVGQRLVNHNNNHMMSNEPDDNQDNRDSHQIPNNQQNHNNFNTHDTRDNENGPNSYNNQDMPHNDYNQYIDDNHKNHDIEENPNSHDNHSHYDTHDPNHDPNHDIHDPNHDPNHDTHDLNHDTHDSQYKDNQGNHINHDTHDNQYMDNQDNNSHHDSQHNHEHYDKEHNPDNSENTDEHNIENNDNNSNDDNNEPDNEPEPDYPPDLDESDDTDEDDREEDTEKEDVDPESHKYREDLVPECAFGHSYCHFDDDYPEASMRKAVDKQMDILTQILPESTETFDLVEGVPKEIDENYTYIDSSNDLYNSESSEQYSYKNGNELSYKDGGYICPSYVNYIQPKRAQNNDGSWKVVLNLKESYRGVDYNQHIRIEECVYEKAKCSFAPNYLKSECIQKYSNERLLAWTPDKGIHLDVFRLPIACSCHITRNSD